MAAVLASPTTGFAEILNMITGSLGPIGLPLACGIAASVLKQVAGTAERAAREAADIRTANEMAGQRHAQRARQYSDLDDGVIPLLRGLADGTLHPDDSGVQRACAIEAGRMRRLFAETDMSRPPCCTNCGTASTSPTAAVFSSRCRPAAAGPNRRSRSGGHSPTAPSPRWPPPPPGPG